MNTPTTILTLAEEPQVIQAGVAGNAHWRNLHRFYSYVRQEGTCWIWTGSFYTQDGQPTYGQIWLDGRRVSAHRASYLLHKGPIPDGKDVLHSCDVKACVNPLHLRPGTHAENLAEAAERHGNWARYGENHGRAKLTQVQVDAIREARARGAKQSALAAQYGVSQVAISKIVRGLAWTKRPADKAEAAA